jgi:hypothetical protein
MLPESRSGQAGAAGTQRSGPGLLTIGSTDPIEHRRYGVNQELIGTGFTRWVRHFFLALLRCHALQEIPSAAGKVSGRP